MLGGYITLKLPIKRLNIKNKRLTTKVMRCNGLMSDYKLDKAQNWIYNSR